MSISKKPPQEDSASFQEFKIFPAHPAHRELMGYTGYPRGYSDAFDNIDHKNQKLSTTALKILGIAEGPVTDIVKAHIMHQLSPGDYMLALRSTSFPGRFKFVVDQDKGLYLRFEIEREAEIQSMSHTSSMACMSNSIESRLLESWSHGRINLCPIMLRAGRRASWTDTLSG